MKRIEVVAAVIVEDEKVFATQRGYGEYKDGWEFPGGKIEAGETSEEALAREIREELDVEITVGEHLCKVEHDYPKFHLSLECFLCRIVAGTLVLREHEAAKWLDREHLWDVDWLPADAEAVEKIERNGLSFWKE